MVNGDLVKGQKEVRKLEKRRNLGNVIGPGRKKNKTRAKYRELIQRDPRETAVTSPISGVILIKSIATVTDLARI